MSGPSAQGCLEAQHLVKRFHGHAAVSDVSFLLRPGEILGYLGPNGSGKSMTLKMLTGLIEPTTGRVMYSGVEVTGGTIDFRRRFGYVPEEPHLYLFYPRASTGPGGGTSQSADRARHGKTRGVARTTRILQRGRSDNPHVSKGMKQKTLLIAALLHDPEVLILDEPESGLDVGSILLLRNLRPGSRPAGAPFSTARTWSRTLNDCARA